VAVFQPYAPDKAIISRWILGCSAVALAAFGCWQLFHWAPESWQRPIGGWTPLGDDFPISWALVLSVVCFVAAAGGTWWGVNYARFVDFLQDTETEMTKVSWSSKREVVGSSIVVIATVVILGIWILLVDLILTGPQPGGWGSFVRGVVRRIFG
jgi:preprotein translocase SecE subunit